MYLIPSSHDSVPAITVLSNTPPRIRQPRAKPRRTGGSRAAATVQADELYPAAGQREHLADDGGFVQGAARAAQHQAADEEPAGRRAGEVVDGQHAGLAAALE